MYSALPLDDRIGQTFYIDGALWRYLYNAGLRGFALRRSVPSVPFVRALELIAMGEVLWTPPPRFEAPAVGVSDEALQQRIALLSAFRRSPAYQLSDDHALRARVDEQLMAIRAWLTHRALMSGESLDDDGTTGS
jgi:hypothetical protein